MPKAQQLDSGPAVCNRHLAIRLSEKTGILVQDVKVVADLLSKEVSSAILTKKKVKLNGLGSFVLVKCKGRWAHNPKDLTQPKVLIPDHVKLNFIPCGPLKEAIKGMELPNE